MELPKYNGTVHPKEWLKQVQAHCYLKEIENEQRILKICKLLIDSTITIPDKINSFDELIKALKSHSTFEIFKNSCIAKLKSMRYVSGNIASFIANFRSLCSDAEINNPKEIKNLLLNSYSSNEFFKNEFAKKVYGINSVDEIVQSFSDVIFEELRIIKKSSIITLKHVTTGKYLSSCNVNYQTGSRRKVIFAGGELPSENKNALWSLNSNSSRNQKESYQNDKILYGDKIYLIHQTSNGYLSTFGSNYNYKSPATGHAEVNCSSGGGNYLLDLESTNSNNNTPYVKNKDIITLRFSGINYILRSHDFTFAIGDKTFQEVIGHQGRIGGNDEWQIEMKKEYYLD